MKKQYIESFSSKPKHEKMAVLSQQCGLNSHEMETILLFYHPDREIAKILDEFSENTLAHYMLPLGIAPNFLINGKYYHVPMVTEESSVVAAAAAAAKFWAKQGGFITEVISPVKNGHIHFLWRGSPKKLFDYENTIYQELIKSCSALTRKMEERGGGIRSIRIINAEDQYPDYFRVEVKFGTADSMGANFINSCLEQMAVCLREFLEHKYGKQPEILMAILSNHNPESLVKISAECLIEKFSTLKEIDSPENFARRMKLAFDIAAMDISRAATHNKGIMNGIDAVVLATGNDFRAVEAGAHAWASASGKYTALSSVLLEGSRFKLSMTLPLSVGTVGGVTTLHPLVQIALKILGNPDIQTLMSIIASVGLASNFAAVKALVTQGIQQGHMKMHLNNILRSFNASVGEILQAKEWFQNKTITVGNVENFLTHLRNGNKNH